MAVETFDRRRHRSWLALLVAVAALLAIGVVGLGLMLRSRIDPKAVRARLVAAVEQETGRRLQIDGPVSFHFLPRPEIAASDITLSNIEGGTAPAMLSVRAAEADIAILPLLRREVRLSRLTLYAPQVTFERRPDGVWNWVFQRKSAPAVPHDHPTSRAAQGGTHSQAWSIGLDHLRVEGGKVTVLDRLGGERTMRIDLRDLNADAVSSSQPAWRLRLLRNGIPVTIEARTGPLTAVTHGWPDASWPLRVMALQDNGSGTSASLRAVGTLSGGKAARGFDLDLHASVPDLTALQPLVPEYPLPSMQAAAVASRLSGALGGPEGAGQRLSVQSLHAQTGPFAWGDLSLLAGSIDAAAATAPVALHLSLRDAPTPMTLTARIGTLEQVEQVLGAQVTARTPQTVVARWIAWFDAATGRLSAPMNLAVSLDSGKVKTTLDGALAPSGSEVKLAATMPDLQAAWSRGPHLTNATLGAILKSSPGGHLSVDDLALHADQGDVSGRAGLAWTGEASSTPQFNASLRSTRLDTDALRQDTPVDPHVGLLAPHAPPASSAASTAPPTASPPISPPATQPGGKPETVLPFKVLHAFDGALSVEIGSLVASGATYKDVRLRAALAGGQLQVDPLTMVAPQGPLNGRMTADAAAEVVTLALHAPFIPASSLALLFPGWSSALNGVSGTMQVEADLHGQGGTVQAVLSSLGGTLGLSSVDGRIPNALLGSWIHQIGGDKAAGKPDKGLAGLARGLTSGLARIEGRGDTTLRCFASAAHIADGLATLDPIVFDTARLSATGHGTLALGPGDLDLHLMASALLGGTGASTPVHLTGAPGAISVTMDPGLPGGRFGIVIGGAAPPDPCPAALDAARFGQPGPAPAPRKSDGKAADVLRGLGLLR